jgi:hypothetical protein
MSVTDNLRARLRVASRTTPPAPHEPAEYVDARTEARTLCRDLGLDVTNQHWDTATVGDFLRLAYAGGWKGCEARINSPDVSDAIALAVEHPERVVDRVPAHWSVVGHVVAAVQRVVVYGAPKDLSELPTEERRELLRVPTHTDDGERIPEWERELFARPAARETL